MRRAKAERHVYAFERLEGQSHTLAHLRVGAARARMLSTGSLEVSERQVAGLDCGTEISRVDAHCLQVGHDPRPHDVSPREGAVVAGRDDAKFDELADALDAASTSARELLLGKTVAARIRIGDKRVTACLGAEPVALAVVLGRRHRVVRVDPHAAHGIGHDGHGIILPQLQVASSSHRVYGQAEPGTALVDGASERMAETAAELPETNVC